MFLRTCPSTEPCLPRPAKEPPLGPGWIHEIKHDGFRIMARRDGSRVRLISRNGHDLTYRFPPVAAAIAALPVRSCLIDGAAIVCNGDGLAVFQFVRNYRRGNAAALCAFDVIEINGQDLRRQPIEDRKLLLKELLSKAHPGIAYNRHFDVEGVSCFIMPASLAVRASYRNGSAHPTHRAASTIGSRSRTHRPQRRDARRKRI